MIQINIMLPMLWSLLVYSMPFPVLISASSQGESGIESREPRGPLVEEVLEHNTPSRISSVEIQSKVPAPGIDYLTFASGAVPISIAGEGAQSGVNFTHAVQVIDGNPSGFTFTKMVDPGADTEFIYGLPALTTFERLAVPNVLETPSPSQTFSREVEVYGSTTGPEGAWEILARATLETHPKPGQETELEIVSHTPVKWVKVRLVGGIEVLRDKMFFEFSEIIGNGTQETPELARYFDGIWKGRGVLMELKQDGATVTGCYDRNGELNGTVTGNILRATGVNPDDGVISLFILNVLADSLLRGVRSTNGSPFRLYTGPPAPEGTQTRCSEIPQPELGCGSVIHGINFDFNSADIRQDSEPVLADLYEGLKNDPSTSITIEGHTSSEGTDAYNQELSERRAQSVVDYLVGRGLANDRINAEGKGEAEPISSNEDESGRSLNRRVEVICSE